MANKLVRVLSIQSHVVSGYVGNKSACFPLQVLGFEVDAVNSVQFSNHTGYGFVKGQILNAAELEELILGLENNGLNNYSHLLTGYIGSKSFLEAVKKVACKLKAINPDLIYVCDPVLGDDGKMYVPEELLAVYQQEIIPLANIVTPNQFEAELLTGQKISKIEDICQIFNWFHKKGVKTIVISSTDLGGPEELIAFASSITDKERENLLIKMPRLPAKFTGTGDLFTALFMAWMHRTHNNLKEALERTVATMQQVILKTLSSANEQIDNENSQSMMKNMELKLIQSLDDIRIPQVNTLASPF